MDTHNNCLIIILKINAFYVYNIYVYEFIIYVYTIHQQNLIIDCSFKLHVIYTTIKFFYCSWHLYNSYTIRQSLYYRYFYNIFYTMYNEINKYNMYIIYYVHVYHIIFFNDSFIN